MINSVDIKRILEDQILPRVNKPGRYIDGEINSIHKPHDSVEVKVALAFPDVYELGMSHLGLAILYQIINRRQWALAERVFAPWIDMEEQMRKKGLPLYALESFTPLQEFDIVGFSLQYELCYTNVLSMIDLAGMPLASSERMHAAFPLIIAGGPCAFNPEPLAEFIDCFVIGDGEDLTTAIVEEFRQWNGKGNWRENPELKIEFLRGLATKYDGVYVPMFYEPVYREDGSFQKLRRRNKAVPETICKASVRNLDYEYYPATPVVPLVKAVHDRVMLEIMRGCGKGCRFCQAGMIYRPLRKRTPDYLIKTAEKSIAQTGFEEISLSSLSTGDYPGIQYLVSDLIDHFADRHVGLSLPSMRIEKFPEQILQKIRSIKKTGLTLALETGSERLRKVIRKNISNEELFNAAREAYRQGWRLIKLYLMIGLPSETMEDIEATIEIIKKLSELRREVDGRRGNLNVSITAFIPKSHTPFQWCGFDNMEHLREKIGYIRDKLGFKNIRLKFHALESCFLEAVFARGDRRLAQVLIEAWKSGIKFDEWTETFDFNAWLRAFSVVGIDPEQYAYRRPTLDEPLPWDHIQTYTSKKYMMKEFNAAFADLEAGE